MCVWVCVCGWMGGVGGVGCKYQPKPRGRWGGLSGGGRVGLCGFGVCVGAREGWRWLVALGVWKAWEAFGWEALMNTPPQVTPGAPVTSSRLHAVEPLLYCVLCVCQLNVACVRVSGPP